MDVRFLGLTSCIPGQICRGNPFSGQQIRINKFGRGPIGITSVPRQIFGGDHFGAVIPDPKKWSRSDFRVAPPASLSKTDAFLVGPNSAPLLEKRRRWEVFGYVLSTRN